MSDLRTAAQQALAFTMRDFASLRDFEAAKAVLHDNLRAALAQQDEPVEPVAWMFELARNFNLVGYGGWEKRITEYRPNTPEGSVRNVTALYTAPPQRKPLTEKEMYAVEEEARKNFRLSQKGPRGQQITYWDGLTPWLIRAVERAHGIKE